MFEKKKNISENSHLTNSYYVKLCTLRTGLVIMYFLSIMVGMAIFDNDHSKYFNPLLANFTIREFLLIFCSFLALNQITLEILIYRITLKYVKFQGLKKNRETMRTRLLLVFIFIALIHPNYIFENFEKIGVKNNFTYYNTITKGFVTYSINDILVGLNLLKLSLIFYNYFANLNFNSDVASRCWFFKKQDKRV